MRVFVTGATGFIGGAVAAACERAGHEVWGLVRDKNKARRVEEAEIRPVFGALDDPASYSAAARDCHVLVHCAAESSARQWDLDRSAIETLLDAARSAGTVRKVIVTSGVWLYGDTGSQMVDESSPLNPPAPVAQRPGHEQMVLAANGGRLQTLVIRPGCVYGGAGSLTGLWFDSAVKEGAARIVGDGAVRWAMVHIQDLADLYVRAAESPWGGEIFNATDRSRFTVLECARAASLAAGHDGKVATVAVADAVKTMGAWAACLAMTQHVDSRKAVRLLGWQPRHGGFVDGAQRSFIAWRAHAGMSS